MEDQIYIIIAKVLQGEASASEQAELDAWLVADAGNPEVFNQMKAVWEEADSLFQTPGFDTAGAWDKVAGQLNLESNQQREISRRGKVIAFPNWLGYTSALAAILVVALLVWNPFVTKNIQIAALEKNTRVVLPDESVITLRKGSSLTYPKHFESDERKVALEGEAFFEVAHNEQQPFVVDAQAVSVKVLGTTFDVDCSKDKADVSVATGKVQVSSKSGNNMSVVLTPGNKVHYENGQLTPAFTNGFESSWKKDTLSFNGTPFSTVLSAIANVKKVSITPDSSLSATQLQQAITVSFPTSQPLEEMLTELCLITHCRWEKRGNSYIIRTK